MVQTFPPRSKLGINNESLLLTQRQEHGFGIKSLKAVKICSDKVQKHHSAFTHTSEVCQNLTVICTKKQSDGGCTLSGKKTQRSCY